MKIFEKKIGDGIFEIFNAKPSFLFHEVNQVHGCAILPANLIDLKNTQADGLLSEKVTTPLAIKTADCIPLLLLGKKGTILIHSGWRGVYNKIFLTTPVKQIDPYYAFIGPSIQKNNFEVTNEFFNYFPEHKQNFHMKDGKHFFNLQKTTEEMLKESFPSIQIEDCGICTVDNLEYRSFRREKIKVSNWNIWRSL